MRNIGNFWFVLKVKAQHELKVVSDLTKMGIPAYTPYLEQWRQWSDRKKKIQKPLISRHVFVRLCTINKATVFDSRSVVGYLNVKGQKAKVWPEEIRRMQQYCKQKYQPEITIPGSVFKAPILNTDVELLRVHKNKMCSTISECGRFTIKFKLAS